MRPALPTVLCCVLLSSLFGGAAEPEANVGCIARLEIPTYPALAGQARVAAIVTAKVKLTPDGKAQGISLRMESGVTTAKELFTSTVEDALRASSYSKGCEDKPITLIFDFVLEEHSIPNRATQTVSFGYPNRFWITMPPNLVNW